MGQLLAAVRKSSKVDNPNAWIEIRPNRFVLNKILLFLFQFVGQVCRVTIVYTCTLVLTIINGAFGDPHTKI